MNAQIANPTIGTSVVIASLEAGDAVSEIELIPTGTFVLGDGRGKFHLKDAARVIADSFKSLPGGVDFLPVDFDHGIEGEASGSSRAAGWITALRAEGQRIIATVEWTPAGRDALADKTYRFISPVFLAGKKDRVVRRILRAGLTNNPAIRDLAQVASMQGETETMNPLLEAIAAALGLSDVDDDAVISAAVEAIGQSAHVASIAAAAGHTGVLTDESAERIAGQITAAASATPDPAKFVPIEAFQDLTTQVASLQKTVATSEVEDAIAAAAADGKISPAMRGWARDYAERDLDGFKAWAACALPVVSGGEIIPALVPSEDGALTATEKEVCAAMGQSEEDFIAIRDGKPLKKEA